MTIINISFNGTTYQPAEVIQIKDDEILVKLLCSNKLAYIYLDTVFGDILQFANTDEYCKIIIKKD